MAFVFMDVEFRLFLGPECIDGVCLVDGDRWIHLLHLGEGKQLHTDTAFPFNMQFVGFDDAE